LKKGEVMGIFDFIPAVKKSSEANEINQEANSIVSNSRERLERRKKVLKDTLENYGAMKVEVLSTTIYDFVENFEKLKDVDFNENISIDDVTKIRFNKVKLGQLKEASVSMKELAAGGITAIGSGALTGAAVYGTVGLLASASTGTAISALSGAAATNATLAWLGGGAIAAGGGGIALGTIVLGGIVAAPVVVVGYMVFNAKANKNLAAAKQNLLKAKKFQQEINLAVSKINAIINRVNQMEDVLSELNKRLVRYNNRLAEIIRDNGIVFPEFSEADKKDIYMAMLYAQATKAMLDIELLNSKGDLTKMSKETLLENKKLLESMNDGQ
jgi:hypothetical protein